MKSVNVLTAAVLTVFFAGCGSYITPGERAELAAFAPSSIRSGFEVQPSRPFPAAIAAVRIQGRDYTNYNLERLGGIYGEGRYRVVLTREVEQESDLDAIRALPQIADLISLNRMLLPPKIDGPEEIREAASKLRADLVLLYTFDTKFFDEDQARPLTVITLGLAPNRRITATTTASALIMDTRSGFIYGALEATAREAKSSTSWGSRESADEARLETEQRAFAALVGEFQATWPRILERYGNETTVTQRDPARTGGFDYDAKIASGR